VDPEAPAIREAKTDVLKRLRVSPAGSIVPIELEDIVLTGSCLAALLEPILERIVAQEFLSRFVLACDPLGQNEWDADAALRKLSERRGQKLVCVWETNEDVRLVGVLMSKCA
jgi:hypothetical protein